MKNVSQTADPLKGLSFEDKLDLYDSLIDFDDASSESPLSSKNEHPRKRIKLQSP